MGRYILAALLLIVAYIVYIGMSPAADANTTSTDTYRAIAREDARAAGIDADLFVHQINQESGFNPAALSRDGAIGIAQFMPATARGLGIDPYEPLQSLKAAALLMSGYVRSYGSYAMALAAYNAGSGTLHHAIRQCGSYWRSCLPAETRAYINIIMME